jgi:MFS family permease
MMRRYEPVRGYFPYPAVISVTLCLFANNYAITSCFSYTGAMVVHLGVASTKDEAGYFAGLLAASFMIGRGTTALVWGILADKYGRRPVLITCCLAMIVFQLMFGFSVSFGMAIASRFFLGFFNGLVGTSKTAVAELVPGDDVRLQSKAMGILGGAVSFGQLIGPSVGGWLADPVKQFPATYKGNQFLEKFPFILPNIIGAFSALMSTVAVYCFLPETQSSTYDDTYSEEGGEDGEEVVLYNKNDQNDPSKGFKQLEMINQTQGSEPTNNTTTIGKKDETSKSNDMQSDQDTKMNSLPFNRLSPLSFCKDWRVLWPCLVYSFHSLNSMWLNEVFPLWCLGSKKVGGLSMSLYEIGLLVSLSSIMLVLFQALCFHRLVNFLSPTRVFIGGTLCMVPFVALLPLTSGLSVEMNYTFTDNINASFLNNLTIMTPEQESRRGGMMTIVGLLFGMTSLISVTTFSTSFMLINNSCSNDDRGAVNGLAMTVASITKAVGPVMGSSLLAWSFQYGRHVAWIFGHTFNFWLVACLWLMLGFLSNKVLFKYKLDVHYQANSGNEVNFKNISGKNNNEDRIDNIDNNERDGEIHADLDEDETDGWADI